MLKAMHELKLEVMREAILDVSLMQKVILELDQILQVQDKLAFKKDIRLNIFLYYI